MDNENRSVKVLIINKRRQIVCQEKYLRFEDSPQQATGNALAIAVQVFFSFWSLACRLEI